MESHVERLIKFLEKLIDDQKLPKMLLEDIEWVVKVISDNQLYSIDMSSTKYNKDRKEIIAWLSKMDLSQVPLSFKDIERSNENEEKYKQDHLKS